MAPRRTSRAEKTRQRLLRAGRRAFARNGLSGTNLRTDILEPAGVSVGSFYHQFADKTELLLTILSEHADDYRSRLSEIQRPRPGRSLEELVRDTYELVFASAEENADLLRIQLRERDSNDERVGTFLRANRQRLMESLSADFQRIADAAGAPPVADGAAELTVALAHGAIALYLETPRADRRAARERLVENLVHFTLGGTAALLEHT